MKCYRCNGKDLTIIATGKVRVFLCACGWRNLICAKCPRQLYHLRVKGNHEFTCGEHTTTIHAPVDSRQQLFAFTYQEVDRR